MGSFGDLLKGGYLGFRVSGLAIWGLRCRVQGLGFMV